MKNYKGIEGDYLEVKDSNLIFDIKGLVHPDDRKICFIRFYPHPEGDRERSGTTYKKIYNIEDRYKFLKEHYPQYVFYSKQRDLALQGVPTDEIKKIYTPRDYFQQLQKKNSLSRIEKSSLELCQLLIENSNLPDDAIGVTGSPMVGLNKNISDIDLIIYGTEVSRRFQESMKDIFKSGSFCREYNLSEYQSHYQFRAGGSAIPFDKFYKCEKRKLHQGMFKGFEFFIRYIKSPKDWPSSYYDYQYKDYGRIKIRAKITEDKDSIFTPCTYKIEDVHILDDKHLKKEIEIQLLNQINSYRGRFCEQAKKGENVLVVGKIEKVVEKQSRIYYRLLLQDQERDKMLLLE